MYYYAWIRVLGWYARQLSSSQDELLIVTHQKSVLDASPAAIARGVKRGMSSSEARAILPEGTFRDWKEAETLEAATGWWDQVCEWTNGIAPHLHHEAAFDLTGHPDPIQELFRIQRQIEQWLGLEVQAGLAGSVWIARMLCGSVPTELRPIAFREAIERPASAIADYSVAHLPIEAQTRQRLHRLGYTKIGKAQEIPRAELVRQFGEEGHRVEMACRGQIQDRLTTSYPPGMIADSLSIEGGIVDLEGLQQAIETLATRLGEHLTKTDQAVRTVQILLELEGERTERRTRTFVKAIDRPLPLRVALVQMLSATPDDPITRLQVRLGPLQKVRSIQRDLTGQTERQERTKSAFLAIDRLKDALGDGCIRLGSEIEEPRRTRVMRAWKDASGWN